jgi:hypothetical protein
MRSGSWLEIKRSRAFLSHLALSGVIVGAIILLILLIWYPSPYFQAIGAWSALKILVGVDLIVGPLLTLIVFKPGKPRLAMDLAVIAAVQLVALSYGVTVLYQERPYYTVFAVDRLYILADKDVSTGAASPAWIDKPLRGPLYAAAVLPEDVMARQRLMEETVFEGKPDIHQRPEFWVPYAAERASVLERGHPLSLLLEKAPEEAGEISALINRLDASLDDFVFLPLEARTRFITGILSRADGRLVAVLDLDAWDVLREKLSSP